MRERSRCCSFSRSVRQISGPLSGPSLVLFRGTPALDCFARESREWPASSRWLGDTFAHGRDSAKSSAPSARTMQTWQRARRTLLALARLVRTRETQKDDRETMLESILDAILAEFAKMQIRPSRSFKRSVSAVLFLSKELFVLASICNSSR